MSQEARARPPVSGERLDTRELRAAVISQYVAVATIASVNLGLAILLPRTVYGEYSSLVAGSLIVVQLTDGGLNLAFVARRQRIAVRALLATKLYSALAAAAVLSLIALSTNALGGKVWAVIFYVFAFPAYGSVEIILISRAAHVRLLLLRSSFALASVSGMFLAATGGGGALTLLVIQATACGLVALVACLLILPRTRSRHQGRVKTPVGVAPLLFAGVMIGIPINLLSNGLLLMTTWLDSDIRVAINRLTLLTVLGILLVAPLGAPQISEMRLSHGEAFVTNLLRRTATFSMALVALGGAVLLALPKFAPGTLLAAAAMSCLAGALCAPAIQLGILGVAVAATQSLVRAATTSFLAGAVCVTTFALSPTHDLRLALIAIGMTLCLGAYGLRVPTVVRAAILFSLTSLAAP